MTNAKVTVTKEVAEAIEASFKDGVSVRTMLRHNVHGDFYGVYAPLQTMHVEELAKVLLIGYEVEKSPEDKVREYYNLLKIREEACEAYKQSGSQHRQGWQSVKDTLDILGIKIEGVNV